MTKSSDKKKSYKWVIAFVVITAVCAIGSYIKTRHDLTILIEGHSPVSSEEMAHEIYDRPDDKVNVNTASAEELCSLPKVTPTVANNIIEFREALGGITDITQLRYVPGVSEATFEEFSVYVTIE